MITVLPSAPLFTGAPVSPFGTGVYDVALAGRGYMVDTDRITEWRHQSVPLLRRQADASDEPTEASLNPEDLWRRSFTSFHRGAGQVWADGPQSEQPDRFLESKGVDPWTEGSLTLLKDTTMLAGLGAPTFVAVAGNILYVADGAVLKFLQDDGSWHTVTSTANNITGLATDGHTVWSSHGADGIYSTTAGSLTAGTQFVAGQADGLGFANGRLMAWSGTKLYNIVDGTALSTAPVLAERPVGWKWVAVAESQGFILAACVSGDKSLVYKTTIRPDATALDAPSIAAALPDGEIIYGLYGYLGFVTIGTDRGVRFAAQESDGNLTLGATIRTPNPVRTFEGQGAYIWYGWTNFDAASTGLGRLTPLALNETSPAYASDLMATAQGNVTDVVTWGDRLVFVVEGSGVWVEHETNLVPEGYVTTGRIGFGLIDPKVAVQASVVVGGAGTATISLAKAEEAWVALGQATGPDVAKLSARRSKSHHFNLRVTLNRDGVDLSAGPELEWVTLHAYPAIGTTEIITVPVLLYDAHVPGGSVNYLNPEQELANFRGLRDASQITTYQEGQQAYQALVVAVDWSPQKRTRDGTRWNGSALLTLKTFGGLAR